MRLLTIFLKTFILVTFINLSISCSSDSDDILEDAVTVNFAQKNIILEEDNHIGKEFEIRTSSSVKSLGKVTISFDGDAEYGIDYITQPAAENGEIEVLFPEVSEIFDFKIIPIENNDKNHNVTVRATLKDASGGVKIGTNSVLTQTITNVDIIRNVFFADQGYSTQEDSNISGHLIRIVTNREILTPSQLIIKVETDNAIEDKNYTISEDVIDGHITFNLEKNSTGAEIILETIDDNVFDGDKSVKLTIVSASGGIRINGTREFIYSIEDDDEPAPMNFNEETSEGIEALPENYYNITAYSDFAAPFSGTLEIKVSSNSTYGEHYKTNPETVNGIAILHVEERISDVTIQVVGINNNTKDPDRVVELEIIKATGGVVIGNGITKHTITIRDDD